MTQRPWGRHSTRSVGEQHIVRVPVGLRELTGEGRARNIAAGDLAPTSGSTVELKWDLRRQFRGHRGLQRGISCRPLRATHPSLSTRLNWAHAAGNATARSAAVTSHISTVAMNRTRSPPRDGGYREVRRGRAKTILVAIRFIRPSAFSEPR